MDEVKVTQSEAAAAQAEETRMGPTFSPAVDIFETQEALVLLADMPGVAKEDISIDLEDDRLTITGQTAPAAPAAERLLSQEFVAGRYLRRFALSEVIDRAGIKATMGNDGVLKVTLPKVKQAQPRKITVETG